jgi:hypothetical protein
LLLLFITLGSGGVFYVDFFIKRQQHSRLFLLSHISVVYERLAGEMSKEKRTRKRYEINFHGTCRFSLAAFPHNLNSIFKLLSRDAAREFCFTKDSLRGNVSWLFRLVFGDTE